MPHAQLVATLTLALGAALIGGALAKRMGLSPIMGYLLAGIAIGPKTPLLRADAAIASQLAEIGIVLLMFGVGLHFSPKELAEVRSVAVPGALLASAAATGVGLAVGLTWGWSVGAGLVLGLAVAVSSTVVLMRGLHEQHLDRSPAGRLAIGWLIVEDLVTVVVLVVLPAVVGGAPDAPASEHGPIITVVVTLLKIAALGALVLIAGRRVVPWILEHVARLKSRELFTLAVLAIALGIAYGAARFTGASMALGAFLAGMVVGQTDLSLEAAADALPLRDAFAVLFFVSVGMLFDPTLILWSPGLLLATLGLVLFVKPLVALILVMTFGHPLRAALIVAVGLAQIGEFSFILAALGRELGLLPATGYSVILAVALVSIALNPLLFRLVDPVDSMLRSSKRLARLFAGRLPVAEEPHEHDEHVVICGYGRVGALMRELLTQRGQTFIVIEQDRRVVTSLRAEGVLVISGDAGNPLVLDHAGVARAKTLVLGFADPVATRLAVDHALSVSDSVRILARAGSVTEENALRNRARVGAVVGEREIALELARLYLLDDGVGAIESEAVLMDLRRAEGATPRERGTRLIEVKVGEGSRAAGKRLRQIGLPAAVRVVMIDREGQYQVAQGTTVVTEGDRLLVLSDEESLPALERALSAAG